MVRLLVVTVLCWCAVSIPATIILGRVLGALPKMSIYPAAALEPMNEGPTNDSEPAAA